MTIGFVIRRSNSYNCFSIITQVANRFLYSVGKSSTRTYTTLRIFHFRVDALESYLFKCNVILNILFEYSARYMKGIHHTCHTWSCKCVHNIIMCIDDLMYKFLFLFVVRIYSLFERSTHNGLNNYLRLQNKKNKKCFDVKYTILKIMLIRSLMC